MNQDVSDSDVSICHLNADQFADSNSGLQQQQHHRVIAQTREGGLFRLTEQSRNFNFGKRLNDHFLRFEDRQVGAVVARQITFPMQELNEPPNRPNPPIDGVYLQS